MSFGWVVCIVALVVIVAYLQSKPRKPDFVYVISKCDMDEVALKLVLCNEKEAKDWVELRNKEFDDHEINYHYYKYEEMELDGEQDA